MHCDRPEAHTNKLMMWRGHNLLDSRTSVVWMGFFIFLKRVSFGFEWRLCGPLTSIVSHISSQAVVNNAADWSKSGLDTFCVCFALIYSRISGYLSIVSIFYIVHLRTCFHDWNHQEIAHQIDYGVIHARSCLSPIISPTGKHTESTETPVKFHGTNLIRCKSCCPDVCLLPG